MGKNFYKSRTFWFNGVALVVMVLEAFGYVDFVPDEHVAEYATMVITAINVFLRFRTNESISLFNGK